MATTTSTTTRSQTARKSSGSHHLIKSYEKSLLLSPLDTPPLSRKNSTSSIKSTTSEPAWPSNRHSSLPNSPPSTRKDSTTSQASAQTTASHKKKGLKSLFSSDPAKRAEKERKKKEQERIVLTSVHTAKVRAHMQMDPAYKEFQTKHKRPNVKTAGISGHTPSAHSSAAEQEMRHPHSGPPAVHGKLALPILSRIESHDEPDDELDQWQATRREWAESEEHKMGDIPEMRSRQTSPWASPMQSRESSPNRLGTSPGACVARPALRSKQNSWAGGYQKDPSTGRWKKTPPGTGDQSGSMTPVYPPDGSRMTPDLLAASLAERLNAAT